MILSFSLRERIAARIAEGLKSSCILSYKGPSPIETRYLDGRTYGSIIGRFLYGRDRSDVRANAFPKQHERPCTVRLLSGKRLKLLPEIGTRNRRSEFINATGKE